MTKYKSVNGVLDGPPYDFVIDLPDGLGVRFFESMAKNSEAIHHVEATTGATDTKGSVRSKAIKIASVLRTRGIKEGHVILISSKTQLEQTVALLSCWFVGAIVAPLHPGYDYEDLKRAIKLLQPKVAFCGNQSSRTINRIFLETNIRCPIITFDEDSKQFPIFKRIYECKEDVNFEPTPIVQPKKQPAIIICTLGTESNPKLVAVSHHSVFIRYYRLASKFNKNEKLLSFFPLSCTMHLLASCLCFETTLRLIYIKQFTERSLCKVLQDLKVNHIFIDGELGIRVVQNAPILDFDLSSLKSIFVAGMPLSTTNFARICKAFSRANVNTTYQTIETGMMTVVSQNVFTRYKQKVLSVGKLYPGINIRVVDMTTKQVLGADKEGEIQVQSEALMLGYYRDPEMTSKSFVKDFYKTGDVGLYDSDGYVYIKGRISNYITREGHTFAFDDIEEVIKLNHAVSDVVCFEYNNDIIACVIKKRGQEATSDALLQFVADVLPPYKIPARVIFREVFPKTVLGVVRKFIIKESIAKILHDESTHQLDSKFT